MTAAVAHAVDPLKAPKIRCPHCGVSWESKVVDTRGSTFHVYRRRECKHCHRRFTTHEIVVDHN
jgi:transcriptional regulator NrdR family protein